MTSTSEPNPYLKTKVLTANPAELRLMLFDGALKFSRQARQGLHDKDYEAVFNGITRCQQIILELINSLQPDYDPELCQRLSGLYTFMYTRLMAASHQRDPAILDEVIRLLEFEHETWTMLLAKLAQENAAAGRLAAAAPPQDPSAPAADGKTDSLIGGTVSFQG